MKSATNWTLLRATTCNSRGGGQNTGYSEFATLGIRAQAAQAVAPDGPITTDSRETTAEAAGLTLPQRVVHDLHWFLQEDSKKRCRILKFAERYGYAVAWQYRVDDERRRAGKKWTQLQALLDIDKQIYRLSPPRQDTVDPADPSSDHLPWVPNVLLECRVAAALGVERKDLIPEFADYIAWMVHFLFFKLGNSATRPDIPIVCLRVFGCYLHEFARECAEHGGWPTFESPPRALSPRAVRAALDEVRDSHKKATFRIKALQDEVHDLEIEIREVANALEQYTSEIKRQEKQEQMERKQDELKAASWNLELHQSEVLLLSEWCEEPVLRFQLEAIAGRLGDILLNGSDWGRQRGYETSPTQGSQRLANCYD